jgi:ORF6N domain
MARKIAVRIERIESRILLIRNRKVLFDADLAALYGVQTRRLNEQVRRNLAKFPLDFMFQLSAVELSILMSQFATSNPGRGGRRKLPLVFTEHGALMAATVLNSPRAVEVSLYVVRAFVRLRETLASHKDLAARLEDLEKKTEALAVKHDALAAGTRLQFKQVLEAIRELMRPLEPRRRPIGFVAPEDKKRG